MFLNPNEAEAAQIRGLKTIPKKYKINLKKLLTNTISCVIMIIEVQRVPFKMTVIVPKQALLRPFRLSKKFFDERGKDLW